MATKNITYIFKKSKNSIQIKYTKKHTTARHCRKVSMEDIDIEIVVIAFPPKQAHIQYLSEQPILVHN